MRRRTPVACVTMILTWMLRHVDTSSRHVDTSSVLISKRTHATHKGHTHKIHTHAYTHTHTHKYKHTHTHTHTCHRHIPAPHITRRTTSGCTCMQEEGVGREVGQKLVQNENIRKTSVDIRKCIFICIHTQVINRLTRTNIHVATMVDR